MDVEEGVEKEEKREKHAKESVESPSKEKEKESLELYDVFYIMGKELREKFTSKNGLESLGTCRFKTRIDYIFVNKKMKEMFSIKDYEHFRHGDASDHKLVRVTFEWKQ